MDWIWSPVAYGSIYPTLLLVTVFFGVLAPVSWYFATCLGALAIAVGLDVLIPLQEVQIPRPSEAEIVKAKHHPNGRVYRIAGPFESGDAVPPEAIVGAWRVDAHGEIVGEFQRNSRYDAALWSSGRISNRAGSDESIQ